MIKLIEQRTFLVAKLLLENDEIKTINEVAQRLNLSSKTISRQLSKVEDLFKEYNLQLEKKTGAGLFVRGSAVKKFALLEVGKKALYRREYSPKERFSIIVGTLLSSAEPIKLFVLSSMLNVTDSTISNDLDKLETWFQNQNLKLLRKPGLGVSLLGDERDFRRAIVRYIHEHINENDLLELLQDNLNEETNERLTKISKFWVELAGGENLRRFDKIIHEVERDLGYQFSDNAFIGLIVHISLTIQRIKTNEKISFDENNLNILRGKKEFEIAKNLSQKLSAIFEIDVPENEIAYITAHLLGARSRYSSENFSNISLMDDFRIVQIARSIMKTAAKETGRDINKNQNLFVGLVNHLGPSVSRLKMNLDIRNPLLSEMQQHYPELISLTKKCIGELEKFVGKNLPESEIAYIAMHLGAALSDSESFLHSIHRVVVACPSGMGTSKLLASKIRSHFQNIKIVDQVPILKITPEYVATMDFEFVIATVPIPNPPCKVLTVATNLSREDRIKIEDELSRQNEKFLSSAKVIEPKFSFVEGLQKMQEYTQAVSELLSNFHFKKISVENISDACDAAGNLIGGNDSVKKFISESLMQRENKGSTIFSGHQMILLHCKTNYVSALTIGILQLGEGFDYGGEIVKTAIVMIAPVESNESEIDTIGHIATVLIDRWSFINLLHEGNEVEIRNEIENIFKEFYKMKFNEMIC